MSKLSPVIPMGAVSAPLSDDEVRIMMKSYADAGIEQYLFYERGGTADNIDYMSDEWLDLCGLIFKYAKMFGMKIWLYDEYDCPSGHCRGAVMKDKPEYRSKFIRVYNGGYEIGSYDKYSDILNPAVTDRFIELTHEVYYSRFREYFGDTIIGVFTDEPSFVYPSFRSGDDPEGSRKYSYTDGLAGEYTALTGRDFFGDIISGSPEFHKTYFKMMGKKFRENHIGRVRKWCDGHGLYLTGHLMYEEELTMSLRSSYDSISALRGFSVPGIDELTSASDPYTAEWITLGCLQAAARVTGNGAFCEVSGLGPTDQPLEKKLQMLYLESFFGIGNYLLAMGHADARENISKNSWFTPMNYMQPWYEGMPLFVEEAKKASALAGKTVLPEIYVRYPVEKTAECFGRENNINGTFYSLLRGLTQNQYQWQLLDAEDEVPAGAKLVCEYDTPISDILNSVPREVTVTDENGNIAENIFLRRYEDGTVCVLDLTDDGGKQRTLVLKDNGAETRFNLCSRGIYIKGGETLEYKPLGNVSPEMKLSLDRPNTLRCAFPGENTEYRFTLEDSLDNIKLYIRNYVFDGKVYLDGKEINAKSPCSGLQYGISRLYSECEPLALAAGEHIITLSEHAKSEPYLPAVLVAGTFAADKDAVLRKMPERVGCEILSGNVLYNFAGRITYSFDLNIPETEESLFLSFNSRDLYTKVFIDGELSGEKFINPLVFPVKDGFKGKTVTVKIEQYTSVAPMFGYPDKVIPDIGKTRVLSRYFPGKYESCGIMDMRFVTK